jgi:steroid delta-isomerase-like uncharacterized protein
MSVEENIVLVRRWFKEAWNEGRVQTIYELMHENGACHGSDLEAEVLRGPAEFEVFYNRLRGAFPDIQIEIEDAFGSDDKVAVRWSAVMTHTGDHLGMPATNKQVRISGSTMVRIEKGKIVEGWDNWDQLALMQQINSSSASAASYSNRTVHLR